MTYRKWKFWFCFLGQILFIHSIHAHSLPTLSNADSQSSLSSTDSNNSTNGTNPTNSTVSTTTPNSTNSSNTLPKEWVEFQTILNHRLNKKTPKMKLTSQEVNEFQLFLHKLNTPTPHLQRLKLIMPKTTLELLRAVKERNVSIAEAENMADYLLFLNDDFKFSNVAAFDENTSHIIGRQWSEIDYRGEGMTWQGQRKKYLPYGITDFKTKENLVKFFKVESTLPYFKKIYRPNQ